MIPIGVVILVALAMAAAYEMGASAGGKRLWRELKSDRQLGAAALEKLAEAHGAKVELSDHGV